MTAEPAPPRRQVAGHRVFFPAATGYAIFVLPASVLEMTGATSVVPGLASPGGHAHEMLFGFALAVVAGNQLGPRSMPRLAVLAGLWALARASFLVAPLSLAAFATNVAFAVLVAAHLVPRLARAAKKWRNQALPVALSAICAAAVGFQVVARAGSAAALHAVIMLAVLSFALLLLFMGGRLLAPAVAGQLYRQGGKLDARVQPLIESGLIVAMAIAVAAMLVGEPPFAASVSVAAAAAGLLAGLRLLRWRLWSLRGRPDLLCLAAGYAWLAAGLLAFAGALATGAHLTAAVHVIAAGGLGTLTLNVMAMMAMLKARQEPVRARLPLWGTMLIALATLARVAADTGLVPRQALLLLAALAWSVAFALLLVVLVRARAPARREARP